MNVMYAVNSYTESRTALQALATINQVNKKKPRLFSRGSCVRVHYFTARASYRPAVASVQWTLAGRKKPRLFSRGFLCLRYLVLRLGQLSFAVKKHAGGMF